jgi:hypothetical protein
VGLILHLLSGKYYGRWPVTVSYFPPISSLDIQLILEGLIINIITFNEQSHISLLSLSEIVPRQFYGMWEAKLIVSSLFYVRWEAKLTVPSLLYVKWEAK